MNENKDRLTLKMMVQLAAPHTWSAAIMPVVVGIAFSLSYMNTTLGDASSINALITNGNLHSSQFFSNNFFFVDVVSRFYILSICMLVISILMQSAVNALNDYMDFKRGADRAENQLDPTDAVLVYNNVSQKSVLAYFYVLMAISLIMGLFVVACTNIATLVIGIIGALALVLYSVGKTPLSYLPLGELISGTVMGGLIMIATCNVLLGYISWICVLCSAPLILSIGLINFTNNTCDIEKDIEAKRHTLSVVLGRERARRVYISTLVAILFIVVVLVCVFFTKAWIICILMLFAIIPTFLSLARNPFMLNSRVSAMGSAVTFNIVINCFYAFAMISNVVM